MCTRLAAASLFVLCGVLAGCGDAGPKRFRLSGAVTLDGKPVPAGEVIITPKTAGPQGRAAIKDGRYDTAAADGLGFGGGAATVRVNGMSGPGGKTLCEYEFTADLPAGDTVKDIDVPKKDANNANKAAKKNAPEI